MSEAYHVRDHLEGLEKYTQAADLVWRNDAVRKNDTGRAISWEKAYVAWVTTYQGDLPLLKADHFRELVEEITQGEVDEGDGTPQISVEEFVQKALADCDIQYDPSARIWVDQNNISQKFTTLEARVLEAYYAFRDEHPWAAKKWPEKRVQLALVRIYESFGVEIIRGLRERLKHRPEVRETGEQCLRWILADVLQVQDPDIAIPVFLDWMWQVKRYLYGLPTPNPMMLNIYGGLQGCGKSQLVYMLMNCRGIFRGLLQVVPVSALADAREMDLWSSNYVIFFDELAFASEDPKADGRNLAMVKQVVASQYNTRRDLGKNTHSRMRRIFSAISASNVPLCHRLYDPTGMRRFFEIVVQRPNKMSQEEHLEVFGTPEQDLGAQPETAMDPLLIWQAVDERQEGGYLVGDLRHQVEEIQAGYKRTDALDLALSETDFEIPHPIEGEIVAQIRKAAEGIQRAGQVREILGDQFPNTDLVRVSALRKAVVEWLRDQDSSMVRFLPQHDSLVQLLMRRGHAVFTLGGSQYVVCYAHFTREDGERPPL